MRSSVATRAGAEEVVDGTGTAGWSHDRDPAVGGDAYVDDVNAFNRVMNLGHELAQWFDVEFGSTQFRALTGGDLATTDGVADYIARDGVSACAAMVRQVSSRVAEMLADEPRRSGDGGSGPDGGPSQP